MSPMVPERGFEPLMTSLSTDFKSVASAVSPLRREEIAVRSALDYANRAPLSQASRGTGVSPIICPMGATHVGQGQVLCGRGSIRLIVRDTETFLLRHAPRRCWAIFCARWRKRASSGGPDRRVATPAFRKPSSFRHLRASMNWACCHVMRGVAGNCGRAFRRRREAAIRLTK